MLCSKGLTLPEYIIFHATVQKEMKETSLFAYSVLNLFGPPECKAESIDPRDRVSHCEGNSETTAVSDAIEVT